MKYVLYVFIVVVLSACLENEENNNKPKEKTQLEKAMSTQLDAIEKSKEVEKGLQDSVDKRHKEMEKQGI